MKVRSWGEFLDVTRMQIPFTHSDQHYGARLRTNLLYYRANYLMIYVLLLVYVCLHRPLFILTVLVGVGGTAYLQQAPALHLVVPSPPGSPDAEINRNQAYGLLTIASALLGLLTGGTWFVVATLLLVFISLVHASVRKRNVKSKVTTAFQDEDTGVSVLKDTAAVFNPAGRLGSFGAGSGSAAPPRTAGGSNFRDRFRKAMKDKHRRV